VAVSASRDLRKALDLRPDLASAWLTLAKLDILAGHFADGAAAARRAFESDAYYEVPSTVSTALFASLRANEVDDARRWCRFGLSHYPGDPRFSECELSILGWTGNTAADVDVAWRTLEKIEKQDANHILAATWGFRRLMVGAVLARAKMPDSARAVIAAVKAQSASDPSLAGASLPEAYVQLLLNDADGAIATLAARLRVAPQLRVEVSALPWFRPLSSDARFKALINPTPSKDSATPH
jgi:tetratricopeptide (TPR) repeat protein